MLYIFFNQEKIKLSEKTIEVCARQMEKNYIAIFLMMTYLPFSLLIILWYKPSV
jgi:hypothetical protein